LNLQAKFDEAFASVERTHVAVVERVEEVRVTDEEGEREAR
jgi:hypothetical protein